MVLFLFLAEIKESVYLQTSHHGGSTEPDAQVCSEWLQEDSEGIAHLQVDKVMVARIRGHCQVI